MPKTMGPVMLDLAGTELTQEEKELLQHPLVGGIIFFSRNFESIEQITELTRAVHNTAQKPLWIGVDHEGGRVQRFRNGCTLLPSLGYIGKVYDASPKDGLLLADICGWLMASELLAMGIDLSFAPVLDLNKELNKVIGDRSFDRDPMRVALLANAMMSGMAQAGMAACGKHFPGHGSVSLDSHEAIPIDTRSLKEITQDDLLSFRELILAGVPALMPAHIIFSEVDALPAGFSKIWLQDILRTQLEFKGILFSDDLNMAGAAYFGDYTERAQYALRAGCDMVLICNNRQGAIHILDHLAQEHFISDEKFKRLQGQFSHSLPDLKTTKDWQKKQATLTQLMTENIGY